MYKNDSRRFKHDNIMWGFWGEDWSLEVRWNGDYVGGWIGGTLWGGEMSRSGLAKRDSEPPKRGSYVG
ncbi:hypothetical protein TL16_g00079 [Triparma laevis f. inornata]|uniref:Uncharacterized protein n=1 Tax=Triparma laevis f. inornata TaxID=1714386 RepID=A0A9W7DQY2_9STRA|nr:hypothetical protein TL16_g00079 [Triparma laevis f. inornata]